MFDTPADTWYLFLGVAAASTLSLGVALALPTTAPPDATRVAATVDTVAASPHDAIGHAPIGATEVELTPSGLALRNDAGTAHAAFAYGPVTPVGDDTSLRRVLDGAPPSRVFECGATFRAATATARNRTHEWREAEDRLVVRRVSWRGTDVTLVGV